MPLDQAAWGMGLLALPLVALFWFMRERRRTIDYAETKVFKASLPWWVKNIETLLMLTFGYLWATAGFRLFVLLKGSSVGVDRPLVGVAAVYVVIGLGFIVLPMAMLSANVTSWIVPFLRTANQEALQGTHVSFKSMNRGLIAFASASVPFGMVALLIAAIEPWNR